jgi:hypothetical protein
MIKSQINSPFSKPCRNYSNFSVISGSSAHLSKQTLKNPWFFSNSTSLYMSNSTTNPKSFLSKSVFDIAWCVNITWLQSFFRGFQDPFTFYRYSIYCSRIHTKAHSWFTYFLIHFSIITCFWTFSSFTATA